MSRPLNETDEERELRRALDQAREAVEASQRTLGSDEKERLRSLHWMRCAKCGFQLTEVEFRGVKVDKCFGCGGVYLDDGELELLAGRPGWFTAMRAFFSR